MLVGDEGVCGGRKLEGRIKVRKAILIEIFVLSLSIGIDGLVRFLNVEASQWVLI